MKKSQAMSISTIVIIIILIVTAVAILAILRSGTSGGYAPIGGMIKGANASTGEAAGTGGENLPHNWFRDTFG